MCLVVIGEVAAAPLSIYLHWVFSFFLLVSSSSLFWFKPLIRYLICRCFLLFCRLLFIVDFVLWCTEVFYFDSPIYFFHLFPVLLVLIIAKSSVMKLPPMLSSEFWVSALKFRSFIHSELMFVYGWCKVKVQLDSFCIWSSSFFSYLCWKRFVFSPIEWSLLPFGK